MARKFESEYRVSKVAEVLKSENAFRLAVDLRLDLLETGLAALGSDSTELVVRVLRVIETEISPRAAEIEALLTDYRQGVPAAIVQEESTGRQFMTPERRAAILAELRGGVDADHDTLAKLLAYMIAVDAAKAPAVDPVLAGTPRAPTAPLGTNSTQIATMAALLQMRADLLNYLTNGAGPALDQFNEIAAALGNDANLAASLNAAIAGKQPLDADLTAIAALSTTTFGRALLTMADAASARATINALSKSGDTMTGQFINASGGIPASFDNHAVGANSISSAPVGAGELMVQSSSGGAAMMAFHRPGSLGAYFGVDSDNVLKFGGWSLGANAYPIWHNGLIGKSLAANGYISLPNGLIFQWGAVAGVTDGNANLIPSFPVAFPNGVLQLFSAADHQGSYFLSRNWHDAAYPSKTAFVLNYFNPATGAPAVGVNIATSWFAIGY